MTQETINTIIAGILALTGVIVGTKMTISNSRKQERTQLLSEYYAEVFSSYLVFFSDESTDNLVRFLSSAEKARLLCSAASDKLLKELEGIVVMTDPPLRECKELVDALRLSAKKDVVKG